MVKAIEATKNRERVYATILRFFNVTLTGQHRKKLSVVVPRTVLSPEGKIYAPFLPYIAPRVIDIFPGSGKTAEELIGELKNQDLVSVLTDVGSVYGAILRERESILKLAGRAQKLKNINRRLLALQEMVRELGIDLETNRRIATRCIRGALGFSGVRVYTVKVDEGTWFHRYSEGEEGISRFNEPKVPEENSEKSFIVKLLRLEVTSEEINRARKEGLYEWYLSGEWGYLYIPDRSRCDFVERDQLRRDENGDPAQQRRGYGSGAAREILYLIFGGGGEVMREVYMITNWSSRKPLFDDKERDLELLHAFATSMARARELAGAYQKLQDTSVHDELTGVHNRRYFNRKIEKEFERASRYHHSLTLLMIDIDHFKKINDTYGHPVGDQVLKVVAEILKKEVRKKIDTVVRYGGEEFAIILPETNEGENDAYLMAERIRKAVEKKYIEVKVGESLRAVPVTISIGLASFPKHAGSVEELVYRADKALLSAKNQGRNTVVVYSLDNRAD